MNRSNVAVNVPSVRDLLDALERKNGRRPDESGNGYKACCPAHDDKTPSLSVTEGRDGLAVVHCHAGCDFRDVLRALGFQTRRGRDPAGKLGREVARYHYCDEHGAALFHVVRFAPKAFRQFRPDGTPEIGGVRRVIYRLPDVLAAVQDGRSVFVVEGEKDVETLAAWGLVATCNPMGAGKWRREYSESLRGARVIIIPDNDNSGRAHAEAVARSVQGLAGDARMVTIPEGKDVTEWKDRGGNRTELELLVARAPVWTATDQLGGATRTTPHDTSGELILSPADPLPSARRFLETHYTSPEGRMLHQHQGVHYAFSGSAYSALGDDEIKAELYPWLERARTWVFNHSTKEQELADFRPTKSKVANVVEALDALIMLPAHARLPSWLGRNSSPDPDPEQVIACKNGLLEVTTRRLHPHTPRFFNLNALPIDYDPNAKPVTWLRFLDGLWPSDPEAVACLQEILGYLLTPDTTQQKAFLLVGPKRSGKGTIARVVKALLGINNVCAPTLASLVTNFGLQPLLNKRAAIISDARLSGKADQAVIAERLLSISGEDVISVDRKFLEAWTGQLQARVLILTNELPRLTDSSGALASRFVVLTLTQSFYGREDPGLTNKLIADLPGILNWALEGLCQLRARGCFVQPASSTGAVRQLEDLNSPVGAFLGECCELGDAFEIECSELYRLWCRWCDEVGRKHGSDATFGRDLSAAVPTLKRSRPRDGNDRKRLYLGLRSRMVLGPSDRACEGTGETHTAGNDGRAHGPSWTTDNDSELFDEGSL